MKKTVIFCILQRQESQFQVFRHASKLGTYLYNIIEEKSIIKPSTAKYQKIETKKSGKQDLNLRPLRPERSALPS